MYFGSVLLSFFMVALVLANRVAPRMARTSCTTPKGAGICRWTAECTGSHSSVPGYCPGPTDFQCCVNCEKTTPKPKPQPTPCSTLKTSTRSCTTSTHSATETYATGTPSHATYAPSPTSSSPKPGDQHLKAVDISDANPASFYSCIKTKYDKVVIRAYEQACSDGGKVDPNFVPAYKAAKAAGIDSIDAYMFPCTGTQNTGSPCKSPTEQLRELSEVIKDNGLKLDHVWFDIEPSEGACNAWNLGGTANLALAKEWVGLMRQSGLTWGIYANGNQWSEMFPSRASDVASDLPLWAVQEDYTDSLTDTHTYMGGWTEAYGKQYDLDTDDCGASVDKSMFSG